MRVFDDILDALSDGEEHQLEDIVFKVARDLNKNQVDAVLRFLADNGFIKVSWAGPGIPIRLAGSMPRFLKRIKKLEAEEAPQK